MQNPDELSVTRFYLCSSLLGWVIAVTESCRRRSLSPPILDLLAEASRTLSEYLATQCRLVARTEYRLTLNGESVFRASGLRGLCFEFSTETMDVRTS